MNPTPNDPATPATVIPDTSAAVTPGAATAQPTVAAAANNFSVLDTNADGVLNATEVSGFAELNGAFATADLIATAR
jgi:hypothetical protein